MSRNEKPDNIVDAFMYIAKRCLTAAERDELAELLRDPRIVRQSPQQQQPQQQAQFQQGGFRGRGRGQQDHQRVERGGAGVASPVQQGGRRRGGNGPVDVPRPASAPAGRGQGGRPQQQQQQPPQQQQQQSKPQQQRNQRRPQAESPVVDSSTSPTGPRRGRGRGRN
jgi:hypothetical protein